VLTGYRSVSGGRSRAATPISTRMRIIITKITMGALSELQGLQELPSFVEKVLTKRL
jgi:hypothetical protein